MATHMISKKKLFLWVMLFIIALTTFRVMWVLHYETPKYTEAEQGVIDLSGWEFTDDQTLALDGEWEFYPQQFVAPAEFTNEKKLDKEYITVPKDWSDKLTSDGEQSVYGNGTYRLRIQVPNDDYPLYGLRFKELVTAATIFVDGKQIIQYNAPNTTSEKSATELGPFYSLFPKNGQEIDLVIHVSNYEMYQGGGITESVNIGTSRAVMKEYRQSIVLQLIVGVMYLLHSIYAFFIYSIGKRKNEKEYFYYGLLLLITAFTILIDDAVVLQLPFGVQITYHILWIGLLSNLLLMTFVVKHLFNIRSVFIRYILGVYLVIVGGFIVLPFELTPYTMILAGVFYLLVLIYLFKYTFQALKRGYPEAILILFWIASYISNIAWGIAIQTGGLNIPYYPFDYIVSLLVIVLLLFKQHQRIVQVNEKQTAQLKATDEMKDEFLANTSHELRNPLHGIITIAQTLLRDDEDQLLKKNRRSLELLVSVGQQMTLLLNDLLDSRRLQDGAVRLNLKNIRIQGIASGVFDLARYLIEGKNVQLKMNIAEDFPAVSADESRVVQILFNLIQNASKFTNEGFIEISARHDKKMAMISVKDTGIGMNQEMTRKAFSLYEQQTSTTSAGGIGLGLVICKDLVELHGGKISVTSTMNEGTTFTFTLPLANEEALADDTQEVAVIVDQPNDIELFEKRDPVASHNKARVLVVDDDPVNVRVIQLLLDPIYNVTTTTSASEALRKIEESDWDLVISDVMMPVMSGYELTKRIRQLYTMSELPIVLLTARSQPDDIYTGFNAGANDYVKKPVDTVELLARVEGLIELKQSVYGQLRTEAAWLQAQIQPHFLFNTLNTIAALAEIDSERMMRLLEEFGNYLRKSFDPENTSSLVSLDNELDLTRSYIYIEQERFGERLHIKWEIDEDLDIQVPPLSIQPLVENAIRHGVLKRIEGGTVCIRVKKHEGYSEISIIDDGVGIEASKVQALLSGQLPQSEQGIGITNTDRRCKQLFKSGLSIVSEEGKGTTISFQIPQ